MKYCFIILS